MSKALKFKMIYNLSICNKKKCLTASFLYGRTTTQLKRMDGATWWSKYVTAWHKKNFSETSLFKISLPFTS